MNINHWKSSLAVLAITFATPLSQLVHAAEAPADPTKLEAKDLSRAKADYSNASCYFGTDSKFTFIVDHDTEKGEGVFVLSVNGKDKTFKKTMYPQADSNPALWKNYYIKIGNDQLYICFNLTTDSVGFYSIVTNKWTWMAAEVFETAMPAKPGKKGSKGHKYPRFP